MCVEVFQQRIKQHLQPQARRSSRHQQTPLRQSQIRSYLLASQTGLLIIQHRRKPLHLLVPPSNPSTPLRHLRHTSPSVNGGSGYFDGGNNYLTFTKNTTSGAFTCECWFYRGANVTQHNIFTGSNITVVGADNIQFVVTNTGGIGLTMNGVVISATGTAVTRDAWSHLVWVRDASNNVATFVNGNRISTATTSAPLNVVSIGAYFANHSPNGYVADARIVNEAVYDPTLTTLTVPTTPLTAVSNTYLLANFTNAGIFDNTGKNNLETVGNAQIDTSVEEVRYWVYEVRWDWGLFVWLRKHKYSNGYGCFYLGMLVLHNNNGGISRFYRYKTCPNKRIVYGHGIYIIYWNLDSHCHNNRHNFNFVHKCHAKCVDSCCVNKNFRWNINNLG
jgi:hypothetical protein